MKRETGRIYERSLSKEKTNKKILKPIMLSDIPSIPYEQVSFSYDYSNSKSPSP